MKNLFVMVGQCIHIHKEKFLTEKHKNELFGAAAAAAAAAAAK